MKTINILKYGYVLMAFTAALFLFSCSEEDSAPTCNDGIKNGVETGIDCGGQCPPCFSCVDGILNGNEEGIDCGGDCIPCPTCVDGIQNGNESGIDCGGDCPACPTCTDGIQNGDETGIDCGGSDCPACEVLGCTNPNAHNYDPSADTNDGSCETCTDGIQNGDETGIDCGGILCENCYAVGLPGEGGGTIFYDKGIYSDGWRYLEISNTNFVATNPCRGIWISQTNDLGTGPELGAGLENTEALRVFSGGSFDSELEAQLSQNGFSDWYIPSRQEILEVYQNQHLIPDVLQGGECKAYIISTMERIESQTRWGTPVFTMNTGEFFWPLPNQTLRFIRQF